MPRSLQLEIAESVEYLEKSYKQARNASHKERLQMLWWLRSGQVKQHQELSQRLGRDGSTISRWLQKYRNGGLSALLEVKTAPGRTPAIGGEVLKKLQARLDKPEGFRSYGEIVQWLEQECGVSLDYKTVHQTVRYRLGAKLKVPRPQSTQQDEQAVETFKKTFPSP
jgi:transposase